MDKQIQSNSINIKIQKFCIILAVIFAINSFYFIVIDKTMNRYFGLGSSIVELFNYTGFSIVGFFLFILLSISPLTIPMSFFAGIFQLGPITTPFYYIFVNGPNSNDFISIPFSDLYFGNYFVILLSFVGILFSFFVLVPMFDKATKLGESHTSLDSLKIIKNSFSLSLKNAGLIIGASILWALTAWIPYLNVGTTIGFLGLIVLISRSDSVSPIEIFKAQYRKNMGEFFLLISFIIIGTTIGYIFVIIPGIVISIAWSQSIFLIIDKGFSPLEAIKKSNEITYGEKLNIVVGYFLVTLIIGIPVFLLMMIVTLIVHSLILTNLIGLVGYIISILVMIGCTAYIYGELSKKLK